MGATSQWKNLSPAVRGLPLRWLERGTGAPLVCLHAFPLGPAMWEPLMNELERLFFKPWRFICPAFRGFAGRGFDADQPAWAQQTPSIAALAADVLAVLDAAGVEQAPFMACSLGGYVLLEILRQAPERVRVGLFMDSRPDPDDDAARQARQELLSELEPVPIDKSGAWIAERLLPRLLAPLTFEARPEVVKSARQLISTTASKAGVRWATLAMAERPDSRPDLANFRQQMFVLNGEHDPLIRPEAAHAFAAALPNAQLRIVPGAGHLPMLEVPGGLARTLFQWPHLAS